GSSCDGQCARPLPPFDWSGSNALPRTPSCRYAPSFRKFPSLRMTPESNRRPKRLFEFEIDSGHQPTTPKDRNSFENLVAIAKAAHKRGGCNDPAIRSPGRRRFVNVERIGLAHRGAETGDTLSGHQNRLPSKIGTTHEFLVVLIHWIRSVAHF